jgi:uncharacterized protein YcbK (DUF882 family)
MCPHVPKSGPAPHLVELLWKIEANLQAEVKFNSGVRCTECNQKAGGVRNSEHLYGLAVDVATTSSQARMALVKAALTQGCRRIGVGGTYVHLGVGQQWPQGVIWLYS